MRGLKRLLVAVVGAAACARMAAPPGGPPRQNPPVLLGTYPDSGTAPCAFRGEAEFRFDEVTNDAGEPNFGTGSGTLFNAKDGLHDDLVITKAKLTISGKNNLIEGSDLSKFPSAINSGFTRT